jgi:CDP-diacylglycerol--serine O-phosphatidyltransferase
MENPKKTETPTGNPTPHPFKMMKVKDYITILGTVFGVLAIWIAINQDMPWVSCLLIFCGTGCDLLDGFIARRFHQINEIGGQLDSLSDLVVFNVAPAAVMYSVYATYLRGTWAFPFLFVTPVVFVCCGVIRLAWFNISKSAEGYTGLVVPLGALYLVLYYLLDLFWEAMAWYPPLNVVLRDFAPFFIFLVAVLEISPFLVYDKAVKKKQGKTKISIFAAAGVGVAIIVFGLAFFKVAAAVTFIVILIGLLMITAYVLVGFRNWLRVQKTKKQKIPN